MTTIFASLHSPTTDTPPPVVAAPIPQRAPLSIATNLPSQGYPFSPVSAPPKAPLPPFPELTSQSSQQTHHTDKKAALMAGLFQPLPMPQPLAQPPTTPTAIPTNHFLNTTERALSSHRLHPVFQTKYILGEELGSGGFGFVCRATQRSDGKDFAVKFIYRSKVPNVGWARDPELGIVPLEIYFIHQLQHENIVHFHEYFEDQRFCYLVTELHGSPWNSERPVAVPTNNTQTAPLPQVPASPPPSPQTQSAPTIQRRSSFDLFECIEQNERLTESQAHYVFRQIVAAVHYLHRHSVVHRDIKDENILIDRDFNVKLIDFGSAAFVPPEADRLFDRFLGTIQYASPEILRGERYRGPEADVWALGCCLYIMLTGEVPFANPAQAMNSPFTPPTHPLSSECHDVLRRMLDKRPASRATIFDICQHPWLQQQPM
ncbi:hypothetical protein HK102_000388, partial [Quaeritorhiza haematococci]